MPYAVRPALVTLVTPRNTNARSALGGGVQAGRPPTVDRRRSRCGSVGRMPHPPAAHVPSSEGHLPGSAAYGRVVFSLFVAGLATFALLYSTQPLLPDLARQFHVTAGRAALSVSLATLGLGVALLLVGPLTEAIGRTPLIHTSLVVSSAVGLATAAAPTWSVLLVLRGLQGVALAGLSAVALAYLKEEVHASAHARASGLYIGGTAIGGMAGRLLAGWVADATSWRGAVLAIGLFAAICTIAVRVLLPPSRNFHPRLARPRDVLALGLRLASEGRLLAAYGVAFLGMGAFVAVYNAVGFRLVAAPYRLSIGQASLVFLAYALGSLGSTYAGRLADRHGRTPVVLGCLGVMLAGVLLTPVASLWGVAAAIGVLTAGWFGAHGVVSGAAAARGAELGGAGQASALYLFAYYLGSSVFGTAGAAAWTGGGWARVTWVAASLLALALPVAVAGGRRGS